MSNKNDKKIVKNNSIFAYQSEKTRFTQISFKSGLSFLILTFLLFINTKTFAQVNKEIYTTEAVEKNKETIIRSDVQFDVSQLEKQLQKGTTTIKGKMYARSRRSTLDAMYGMKMLGGKTEAINSMIYLVPYNDYIKDYIELKNSSEKPNKKIFVKMHDEVYNMRLEGITNNKGDFTFPNLKPGKYYLFGEVRTASAVKKKYYSNGNVATNAYGQVVAEGYSYYNENVSKLDYVDNIVEVTKDGGNVFINVSNIKSDLNEELKAITK